MDRLSGGRRRTAGLLDLGIWSRPGANQVQSGDAYVAKRLERGVLLAVIDGLGHGPEAAEASQQAVSCLEAYSGATPITLFQRCHAHLKRTRGVVMSLAMFDERDHTLTWLGVGNVEGVLIRADEKANPPSERILLRGGVVGLQLPALYAAVMPVSIGDTLIFATDGISNAFGDRLSPGLPPQQLAEYIGTEFGKGGDDALVLVACVRG
jgi:serine phosphatase RsbU (regulator of sigma subunit)